MTSNISQVFLFSFFWLVVWIPCGVLLALILKWKPFQPLSPLQKLPFVLSLYAIAPFVLAEILSLFDTSWVAIGFSVENILSGSFFLGLIISILSIAGLFGLFFGMGWVTAPSTIDSPIGKTDDSEDVSLPANSVPETPHPGLLVPALFGLGLIIGGVEELIFRGFLTGRLCESFSVWWAGAIASLIFALLHLVWEGKDNSPQLPGLWVMGMVLTLAWWVDHQGIALAWGLHTGWVWSVATVDSLALIQYSNTVPAWVTGIDDKPLAGVMGVGALVLTGLGIAILL